MSSPYDAYSSLFQWLEMLEIGDTACKALPDNQMNAGGSLDWAGHFSNLQSKSSILKLLLHLSMPEETPVCLVSV
jgi:hypothetical protein